MPINIGYPVVYSSQGNLLEPEALINACLVNEQLAPLVDMSRFKKLELIPRHHPELVRLVLTLGEQNLIDEDWAVTFIDSPRYVITEQFNGAERITEADDLTENAAEFTEVAKHPYRLNFNGFNPKLCFVETIYTLDTGSAVRLWVNVLPTEHLPLLKNYEPGERLQLVDQLVLYHDLGAIQRFGADPVVFLQDAPGDLQVSINIGECLFIRRMLPGSGCFIYVPE